MNLLMLTMMIVANPHPTEFTSQTTLKFDFASDWATGSAFGVHRGTPSEIHDCLHSLAERNGAPGSLDDVSGWQIDVVADAPHDGLMARVTLGELFPTLKNGYRGGGEIILNVAAMTGKRSIRLGLDRPNNPASAPSDVMVDLSTDLSARASSRLVIKVPRLESNEHPYEYLSIAFAGSGATRLTLRDIRLRDVPVADVTDATRKLKENRLALRKGLWAWHYDRFLASAQTRQELADFCKREGITDLFLKTPYTYEDESVALTHVAELRELIAALAAGHVRVHALDGQAEFVLKENHDRVLRFVDAIAQYNAASQPVSRFVGVHLDNEPYLLGAWRNKATRDAVHQSYFDLNAAVAQSCKTHKLEFGLDIPFWFDSADDRGRYLYWIDRDGSRAPLIEAIIELADNVAIMSYRERILGAGCVIDCCAKEFELGDRYDTDVLASVELGMGKNVEAGTSLGRFNREYVHSQLATLWSVAHRQRGCAGMAIHYYDAFRELESVQ
jgi:hypothetical protein